MCVTQFNPQCTKQKISFLALFRDDGSNFIAVEDNCTIAAEDLPSYTDENNEVVSVPNVDTTNKTFINDIWIVKDSSEIIIKTSAFLPISLWGIFCNCLLLLILFKNRQLRSPTNLIIGNMAFADLITCLFTPWIFLVTDIYQNYQLGEAGCKIEGAIECCFLICSVMNLCAISYDRLTAIVLPQETRLTRQSAKIVIVVTWFASVAVATPLAIYRSYRERKWSDFLEKYCAENVIVANIYWHVIITMLVWLPLLVMLVCYVSIFVKLTKYEKNVLRKLQNIQVKYRKTVAKTMFIIVSTFMICRLPLTALIFYRNQLWKTHKIPSTNSVKNQVNGAYKILWFASKYLIIVNSALNPMIYGLMNEKFRKALKSIKMCAWLMEYAEKKKIEPVGLKKDLQKETKETIVGSNKSNIFVVFKGLVHSGNKQIGEARENQEHKEVYVKRPSSKY